MVVQVLSLSEVPTLAQVIEDDSILMQIEAMDVSIKSRKIELVVAALCSFNSPLAKKDIFNTPSFIESVALLRRMSATGKLYLARTLLEQIGA